MLSMINDYKRNNFGQFYNFKAIAEYLAGKTTCQYPPGNPITKNDQNIAYAAYISCCESNPDFPDGPDASIPTSPVAFDMVYNMSCIDSPLADFDFDQLAIPDPARAEDDEGKLEKIGGDINFSEEKGFLTSVYLVKDEWSPDRRKEWYLPWWNEVEKYRYFLGDVGAVLIYDHNLGNPRMPIIVWGCEQTSGTDPVYFLPDSASATVNHQCIPCDYGSLVWYGVESEYDFVKRCEVNHQCRGWDGPGDPIEEDNKLNCKAYSEQYGS